MRLLGMFAQPDDETFCCGGTLARSVAEGAEAMAVSFTSGQAGQIRDARAVTPTHTVRGTTAGAGGACHSLGVHYARCLDYVDGTLQDTDPAELLAQATTLLEDCLPDVVFTFGNDGAYGHPDHVTIGAAVTEACRAWQPVRLFTATSRGTGC